MPSTGYMMNSDMYIRDIKFVGYDSEYMPQISVEPPDLDITCSSLYTIVKIGNLPEFIVRGQLSDVQGVTCAYGGKVKSIPPGEYLVEVILKSGETEIDKKTATLKIL